jgi:hypothetical protein
MSLALGIYLALVFLSLVAWLVISLFRLFLGLLRLCTTSLHKETL